MQGYYYIYCVIYQPNYKKRCSFLLLHHLGRTLYGYIADCLVFTAAFNFVFPFLLSLSLLLFTPRLTTGLSSSEFFFLVVDFRFLDALRLVSLSVPFIFTTNFVLRACQICLFIFSVLFWSTYLHTLTCFQQYVDLAWKGKAHCTMIVSTKEIPIFTDVKWIRMQTTTKGKR